MITRRKLISDTGRLFGAGAIASLPLMSSGCALKPYSSASYLHNVIEYKKMNPVFYWTDVMLQAVRDQAITPPPATRAFAMGHLAGFAAINGIDQKYTNEFGLPENGPAHANREIAYGVACSYALADAFQSSYALNRMAFLKQYPNSESKAAAIKWGKQVGEAVIKMRTRDGAENARAPFYLDRYPRRNDQLRWRPTGPFYGAPKGPAFNTFSRGLFPGWGAQKPWVMKDLETFRAPPFPHPRSREFAEQFIKIKELGGMHSTIRSADQTQIAFFWEDGPRGVTPPGHWQLLAMNLLQHTDMPFYEMARAFALMSLGQADAGISTWDTKFYHDVLRPETAIRQRADKFDNPHPLVRIDKSWQSLIPTPNFPAYTSGHSTFSGVSSKILALVYGRDRVTFSGPSPDLVNWPSQLKGVRRTWHSITACADEAGASREYGGIHWHADDHEGLKTGRNLGEYIFANSLKRRA